MTLQSFAGAHIEYWWWVADTSKLSDESIIEGVLNYGNFAEKKQLIELTGQDKFKKIFLAMIKKERCNIRPEVKNYWSLYIDKYLLDV
jgi:hypothetical protein